MARLVAAAFERSVHLKTDDLMAAVVNGWIDPNLPEAQQQNQAIGAASAVTAMSFAQHGYTTVMDGHLFIDGVEGLAAACSDRGLSCSYAVLTADLDTCWTRAIGRSEGVAPGEGRWPLEYGPFVDLYTRFSHQDLDERHTIDAEGPASAVSDAVVTAFEAGTLVINRQQPT